VTLVEKTPLDSLVTQLPKEQIAVHQCHLIRIILTTTYKK